MGRLFGGAQGFKSKMAAWKANFNLKTTNELCKAFIDRSHCAKIGHRYSPIWLWSFECPLSRQAILSIELSFVRFDFASGLLLERNVARCMRLTTSMCVINQQLQRTSITNSIRAETGSLLSINRNTKMTSYRSARGRHRKCALPKNR